MKKTSGVKMFFVSILIILLFAMLTVVISVGIYMKANYDEGVDTSDITLNSIPHIYDKEGEELFVIYNNETRVYTKISSIPDYVYESFVAIEDKRFYSHDGYDAKRLLSATINYISNKDIISRGGGSTITQQLVRNITDDKEDTPKRKMREIARAMYLEDNMSKNEILENYINYIYFGQGAYGIDAASKVFFGKVPSELSIAQAAVLASMPYSPEGNNPYSSDDAVDRILKRQELVLNEMNEQGYISDKEYKTALKEEIIFVSTKDNVINQYIRLAINEAKEILVSSGLRQNEKEAEESILSGDIQIYTNLDTTLQKSVYEMLKGYFEDDIEASFVLTTDDGKIMCAIASRTTSQFDRVSTMVRQPGSTIKPLAVYAPAFDMGILTPNSIVTDEKITVKTGNDVWKPSNWYNGYRGDVSVYDAIGSSINTIAIKTLDEVGIKKSIKYLEDFGITSLTKSDEVYPLAIGGITNGISPFEMTRAYNVFNNDGKFINISFIDKIVVDGKTITIQKEEKEVISDEANEMIDSALRYVVTTGSAGKADIQEAKVKAKTGTTDDVKDYWLCGYTDDITAVLWVGYDNPKTMQFSSSHVTALWAELVKKYYN